jgi:dipeptidase E
MAERQIVGVGGLFFELLDYVLDLTGKPRPRVLWVGTASNEDPALALQVFELVRERAELRLLRFNPWPPNDLREVALGQDAILVAGGNTANMLAVWRVHGFDLVLREAWESGVVLAGSSAGMICWFEHGVTDSFGPELAPLDCLGFLPGSACPHYDGEERRRPVYRALVDGGFAPGYAADDGVALRFVGTELADVVTVRDGARAHRVEPGSETPLPARLLTLWPDPA